MTDRDEIELPPLPPFVIAPIADEQTVRDYARAAVLADRKRRTEQAQPAKPKVHSVAMKLQSDGYAWRYTESGRWDPSKVVTSVTLRWTDGGVAWIDNERDRNWPNGCGRGRAQRETKPPMHSMEACDD